MSGTIGIGVPVPKMLPITGTWTLPFAAYLLLLTNRVVYQRIKNEQYLGDHIAPPKTPTPHTAPDPLFLATRAHLNFLENVPLAFVLAAVAELNGANRKVLSYVMGALLVLRVAHVEVGLRGKDTLGVGRPVALVGTQGVVAGLAAWSAYLVKGYWGF